MNKILFPAKHSSYSTEVFKIASEIAYYNDANLDEQQYFQKKIRTKNKMVSDKPKKVSYNLFTVISQKIMSILHIPNK